MKADVPVPDLIKDNCRQLRGYYVPFVIYKDDFKINNDQKRYQCLVESRCHICGTPIYNSDFWYVAGPGSLFHPNGRLIDGAMHYECGKYALQVCPYLAYNTYNKKLDMGVLQQKHSDIIIIDPTVELDRVPLFGFVKSERYTITVNGDIRLERPYKKVQFWKNKERINANEGIKIVRDYLLTKYNSEPVY